MFVSSVFGPVYDTLGGCVCNICVRAFEGGGHKSPLNGLMRSSAEDSAASSSGTSGKGGIASELASFDPNTRWASCGFPGLPNSFPGFWAKAKSFPHHVVRLRQRHGSARLTVTGDKAPSVCGSLVQWALASQLQHVAPSPGILGSSTGTPGGDAPSSSAPGSSALGCGGPQCLRALVFLSSNGKWLHSWGLMSISPACI